MKQMPWFKGGLDRYEIADNGCWEWQGYRDRDGYGHVGLSDVGTRVAHRAMYERDRGPIPDGLTLDHLCRNRGCVNPDHLQPVTAAENTRRGALARTHCKQGHPFDEVNTYVRKSGGRDCRACINAAQKRYQLRKQRSA